MSQVLKEAGSKGRRRRQDRNDTETRYQISYHTKQLIGRLDLSETVSSLDFLTNGLSCTCGKHSAYTFECLPGPSKVIGSLLDRYFELASPPHDPSQIWRWTRSLVFSGHSRPQDSRAVETLREDNDLRRAIHRLAFAGQTDETKIWDIQMQFSSGARHDGLRMNYDDIIDINEHAFRTANIPLWKTFYYRHDRYSEKKGPDRYRKLLRAQARQNPEIMRVWSKSEHDVRLIAKRDRNRWPHRNRRWEEKEKQRKEVLRAFFRDNKTQV